jgi:hypothetical protein
MRGVQPKTTNEILAYAHDLKGFAGMPTFVGGEKFGKQLVEYGKKHWVSFEEYQKKEDEYKALVDKLGQFNKWLIDPTFPNPIDRNVVICQFEFVFSEFFVVEKCVGGQEKK